MLITLLMVAAAAIREASSSPSLKQNSTQCKPKLKVGPSASTIKKDTFINNDNSDNRKPRNRDELLYKEEEEKPHTKIDKLIEEKNKEAREKQSNEVKKNDKKQKTPSKKPDNRLDSPSTSNSSHSKDKRKLNGKDTPYKKLKIDKSCKPFNELLNGVTLVISGIQNPERANTRSNALEMGAKYKSDWDDTCTHLM